MFERFDRLIPHLFPLKASVHWWPKPMAKESDRPISTNAQLMDRLAPIGPRKRSFLFRQKLKLFCALHRPISLWSRLYHYIFIGVIFFSCVVVNVFDSYFDSMAVALMAMTDLLLTMWLTVEFFLRLFSSDCISDYYGLRGKFNYLWDYGFLRALDIIGLFTFVSFIKEQTFDGIGIVLRILHVFQIFQVYRIMLPILKLMTHTIWTQFSQLYVALTFLLIIFFFMSLSVFLKEMDNFNILESFWFTYITLSTIGYGDLVPKSQWGKVLTCALAFCGTSAFQLPANIFGTGLAIKLRENEKRVMFQSPAASLIQTYWRCFSTRKASKKTCVWKSCFLNKDRNLTKIEKICIRFIFRMRYFKARRLFKSMTNSKIGDESEEQLELLTKVTLIETSLIGLKDQIRQLRNEYDSLINQLELLVHQMDSMS